jgi:nucleoside permease NupC
MLIVFIAFVAMFDGLLGCLKPLFGWFGLPSAWIPDGLSLKMIFGWLFAPAAMLMGVEPADQQHVGALLGAKLSINEHYAYLEMKKLLAAGAMQKRSFELAAYALTGFANFASVGIQLGGIGASLDRLAAVLEHARRGRLGPRRQRYEAHRLGESRGVLLDASPARRPARPATWVKS